MKAFAYCKHKDCGHVVAGTREEAIALLEAARDETWYTTVGFVEHETSLDKGIYPMPYDQYGVWDWEEDHDQWILQGRPDK